MDHCTGKRFKIVEDIKSVSLSNAHFVSSDAASLFINIPLKKATLLICNFIEITLCRGCSPVNLQHIFRALFPKNISKPEYA